MSDFQAGKSGGVLINGAALNVEEWSCSDSETILNTSNSGSGSYQVGITAGDRLASGTVSGTWDEDAIWHNNPPAIRAGAAFTNMKLYIESGGKYWDLPAGFITSSGTTWRKADKIGVTFDFQSNGTFTPPGT